jgi:hypothetical protein
MKRVKTILWLASSCAVAAPGAAQVCPQEQRDANIVIGSVARDCVRDETKSLEISGEPAPVVATAAIYRCRPKLDLMRGSCGGDALANELLKRFHDEAVSIVVGVRATAARSVNRPRRP